jgi:mono/diheme cytochrome c family protein
MDLEGKNEKLSAAETEELKRSAAELDEVSARLTEAGRPTPIARQIVGEDGAPVTLPAAPGDADRQKHADNGRRLFTEKGCLACHVHRGTEEKGAVPSVVGEADFGPNLSRVAAKIAPEGGAAEARRRWVVQWVMNPNVHNPRTKMPITHLGPEEASDVAEWLLSQKATDWDQPDVPRPSTDDLVALARVYLGKAPDMKGKDVDDYLPVTGDRPGIPTERLEQIRKTSPDADELRLTAPVTDDKLKWYIARKAISRLGCFGCHDIPGFEAAKPIGTALNDWGRKDPERLAFEDADIFVRNHFNIVDVRDDPRDRSRPAADWHADKDGRQPYEKLFFQALEHHQREGFLDLKLREPRSYDYHRLRTWDDRLRMPQFRFARSHRRHGESAEEYQARQQRESKGEYDAEAEREESEAREAVMTFVLGLVAEAVPAKYVYQPGPDKRAEVRGRQVLDKFNCHGCHQVRPGYLEFKPTSETLRQLQLAHRDSMDTQFYKEDFVFPNHNAWVGASPAWPDRLTAYGTNFRPDAENPKADEQAHVSLLRLADALRFTGDDGVVRDLRSGVDARVIPGDVISHAGPYGGTLADLLVRTYLPKKDADTYKLGADGDSSKGQTIVPPPLHREGERVQPGWLYGFLLNPEPVRPTGFMLLRMPKFNLSPEEARAVVDYFVGASRQTNPGAGVTAQYLRVEQQEPGFWRQQTADYVARLKKDGKLEARVKEMEPVWEVYLKRQVADAEAGLDALKQAAKDAKDDETRKQKTAELARREKAIARWKEQLQKKDYSELRQRWETEEAYATDAFRLLTDVNLCMKCHSIGSMTVQGEQGPNLSLSAARLRPEWLEQWTAAPYRMFAYEPIMPQNFPNKAKPDYQEMFVGKPIDQVRAARDAIMGLPRLTDLPGTRALSAPAEPAGGGK